MTTRFCGPGGNDGNSGLSWALRKLTLSGLEATPVAAGDLCYIGAGTYRETLTCGVSGTAGNPIQYIGDYLGQNTDGVGGVVRITGSNDDKTATRTNCITATTKTYRTFSGFMTDTTTGLQIIGSTNCNNWILDKMICWGGPAFTIQFSGTTQANITVQNSVIFPQSAQDGIAFIGASTVDNCNHLVQNCIFVGGFDQLDTQRVGGITAKNCHFLFARSNGASVEIALTAGQLMTVNNCVLWGCNTGLRATTTAEFSEDYNNLFGNGTDRATVNVGTHSVAYPPLFDPRWFFQLVFAGAGPNSPLQLVTPFDLASFSQLVNLAGTSPTATDMRGTGTIGAQREWGSLEQDSTLKIFGGVSKSRVQTGM